MTGENLTLLGPRGTQTIVLGISLWNFGVLKGSFPIFPTRILDHVPRKYSNLWKIGVWVARDRIEDLDLHFGRRDLDLFEYRVPGHEKRQK